MAERKLAVVYRPLADLLPYPKNARTHSDEQVAEIVASIKAFGFTNPILIDESSHVVAGHGRLAAARVLELEKVPTILLSQLSPAQARAYRLADNKIALNADWDLKLLVDELQGLDTGEIDLTLTGFADDELEKLLTWAPDGDAVPDEAEEIPDPPEHPASKLGDLWVLGRHRLLCGDSTSQANVEAAMKDATAVVSVTDPPYAVAYEKSHKAKWPQGGGRGGNVKVHLPYQEGNDPSAGLRFLQVLPCDTVAFSFGVNHHLVALVDALRESGFQCRKELVWVKDQYSFWVGAAYQQQHESIWICTRGKGTIKGNVANNASTVLEYPRPASHDKHPTAKPVALWRQLIINHSDHGETIFEPFSGSGTSIIAAEMTKRNCCAIELAPAYVDVAVERWQNFTKQTAVLEESGEPFAAVQARRKLAEAPAAV